VETFLNSYLSVTAALLALGLCFLSYRLLSIGGRVRKALLLLVVSALVLRISSALFFCLHSWDERYHAVVATHMMESPLRPTLYPDPVRPYDINSWTENHIWLHKPPMTMWLMAGSMALFGRSEVAVRIPSVILGSLEPLLTFSIGSLVFSPQAAWFAAFFNSINGFLIELESGRTATDHTDGLMTFFVLLSIWLGCRYLRRGGAVWLILSGVVAGASILTKWWAGLTALPIVALLVWGREGFRSALGKGALASVFCAMVVLPWELHIRRAFPAETQAVAKMHLSHFADSFGHPGGPLFHFLQMPRIFGLLVFPAVVWFFWRLARERRRELAFPLAALALWFLVPYLVFSTAAAKMSGLVMISAAPVFIMIGGFTAAVLAWKPHWQAARWAPHFLVLLLVGAPVQFMLERTKAFRSLNRNPPFARELREIASQVPAAEKAVIFNVPWPVEAMFYVPHSVYRDLPTPEELDLLASRGYMVFVYGEREGLPGGLKAHPRVRILEPKFMGRSG
jgi:4-amino-4-deoxy-L-arabinose transferase-like glycosyltransferase